MNLHKINVKYKTMNLHSKFYILFVNNQRKIIKKFDIRINIRIHSYSRGQSDPGDPAVAAAAGATKPVRDHVHEDQCQKFML